MIIQKIRNLKKIEDLIEETTITKLVRHQSGNEDQILYGDEYAISRFQRNQGVQENLSDLEEFWQGKFKSFGEHWNKERQFYRFFMMISKCSIIALNS